MRLPVYFELQNRRLETGVQFWAQGIRKLRLRGALRKERPSNILCPVKEPQHVRRNLRFLRGIFGLILRVVELCELPEGLRLELPNLSCHRSKKSRHFI